MTDKKSLFSLELMVDEIFIHERVACRFPAIAFRLLDFPTIIIHHVEPEVADGMKKKIALDSLYEVPLQFNELKNRSGKFSLRRGKSGLYRIGADTLRSHLETAPLYVMVLDTFETLAKLVANCTVPLSKTMESIYDDITEKGITLPSVHGMKGTYKLYSLIGNEIGHVTLAYRLLSLGPGLLSHIPNSSIASPRKQPSEPLSLPRDVSEKKVDRFVKLIVTNDAIMPVDLSGPDIVEKHTQTVQTETVATQKGNQLTHEQIAMEDDLLITNVVCPPALFYNSKCENPQWDHAFPVYRKPPKVFPGPVQFGDEIDSSVSDVDTIEEPINPFLKEHVQVSLNTPKKESVAKETVMKSAQKMLHEVDSRKSALKTSEDNNRPTVVNSLGNILQMTASNPNLPILNALISELSLLTNQGNSKPNTGKPQARGSPEIIPAETMEHVTNKENLKTFVKRMAVPKNKKLIVHPHMHSMKGHKRQCEQPQTQVPSSKSWIRQAPLYSQRKTKLSYGLTNTQRLRLAKNNPELLKTIEGRDKQEEEIPPEYLGHEVNFDNLESYRAVTDNGGAQGDTIDSNMAGTKIMKKPVPTPRMHSREAIWEVPKSPVSSVERLSSRSTYKSAKSEKSRSIEVRVPSATYHDDTSSQYSSALSDIGDDMTRTHAVKVNNPGFRSAEFSDEDNEKYDDLNANMQMGQTKVVVPAKPLTKPQQVKQKSDEETLQYEASKNDESVEKSKSKNESISQNDEEINLPQYVEKFEDSDEWKSSARSEHDVPVDESEMSEVTYHSMRSSVSKRSSVNSQKSFHSQNASHHSEMKSEKSEAPKSEYSQSSKAKIPPVNPVLSARSPTVGTVLRPSLSDRKRLDSVDSVDTPRRIARRENIQERRARLQAMHERESFNTDSLSSYVPSDADDMDSN